MFSKPVSHQTLKLGPSHKHVLQVALRDAEQIKLEVTANLCFLVIASDGFPVREVFRSIVLNRKQTLERIAVNHNEIQVSTNSVRKKLVGDAAILQIEGISETNLDLNIGVVIFNRCPQLLQQASFRYVQQRFAPLALHISP